MKIGFATDFDAGTGNPEPCLRAIAEAGFTHLHWAHHWNTDFLYGKAEKKAIAQWLKKYDLTLMDIHSSFGVEKSWWSPLEYERQAGVELVENRIIMLSELGDGKGAVMMHVPAFLYGMDEEAKEFQRTRLQAVKRSIDELLPTLEKYHCRLALENGHDESFEIMTELMQIYPAEYVGITYDSGHGNIGRGIGADLLAPLKERIMALHLNDNDSSRDQHKPPKLNGNLDWDKVAGLVASSAYTGPASFEVSMINTPWYEKGRETQSPENMQKFLADCYIRCSEIASLIEKYRNEYKKTVKKGE